MKGKPKYTFTRNGNVYAIREWKYTEHGSEGTKIDEKYSFEEARDEVYRLNGWIRNLKNRPFKRHLNETDKRFKAG